MSLKNNFPVKKFMYDESDEKNKLADELIKISLTEKDTYKNVFYVKDVQNTYNTLKAKNLIRISSYLLKEMSEVSDEEHMYMIALGIIETIDSIRIKERQEMRLTEYFYQIMKHTGYKTN